jgi:hypothetical protein
VALVTLRKGAAEGGWLVLWALLPAVVLAWISGDAGGVLLLAGVFGMAVLLRENSQPATDNRGDNTGWFGQWRVSTDCHGGFFWSNS